MAEETENGQKLNDAEIRRDLLAKSAALKEKTALLKEQMDLTAKAYNPCPIVLRTWTSE